MMPFLINPPKKGAKHRHWGKVKAHERRVNPKAKRKASRRVKVARRAKRAARRTARRFSAAQLAAQRRFKIMVQKRARLAREARRGSASSNPPRRTGGSMARKKRRRSAARRNPSTRRRRRRRVHLANPVHRRRTRRHRRNPVARRRHSRRYRRNPGIGTGNVMRMVTQGVKDGFAVTLGSGLNNFLSAKVPFGQTSAIGQGAVQLLVGTVSGMLVKKLTRSDRFAAFYVAGAYSNVIKKALGNVPGIGGMLSGVGSYYQPALPAGGMGSYFRQPAPALSGWAGAPGGAVSAFAFSKQTPSVDYGDEDSVMMG